jgi:hypothetical protein
MSSVLRELLLLRLLILILSLTKEVKMPDTKGVTQSAFKRQVGGNYYKQFVIQPYEFFWKNKIEHSKAAIIRRILRYDQEGGKGLQDLEKIIHECQLLAELNGYDKPEKSISEYDRLSLEQGIISPEDLK